MRLRPLLSAMYRRRRPVWLGSLGSVQPVARQWGADRGLPVDRWYIDRFLEDHRGDIRGRVLEVQDSAYTDRFGHGVTERGVLDVDGSNERATYLGDLATGEGLPTAAFDCFVLTQTLQLVYDVSAALENACRILRPGGVLLATLPVTSRICEPPETGYEDYWRFTPRVVGRLLEDAFGPAAATVRGRGNVLSQVAFLEGLAAQDLTPAQLEPDDHEFPLIVCARAVKAG